METFTPHSINKRTFYQSVLSSDKKTSECVLIKLTLPVSSDVSLEVMEPRKSNMTVLSKYVHIKLVLPVCSDISLEAKEQITK